MPEGTLDGRFKERAALSGAALVTVPGLPQALEYAVRSCRDKPPREILPSAPHTPPPGLAADRILAAPGLDAALFRTLEAAGRENGLTVLKDGLRQRLDGIDVGFVVADMGIAETGACVFLSAGEEARLASMLCEICVVALPLNRLVASLEEAEAALSARLRAGPAHVSFICGPSRTADIERVLAVGVHGPLEVHIALMES